MELFIDAAIKFVLCAILGFTLVGVLCLFEYVAKRREMLRLVPDYYKNMPKAREGLFRGVLHIQDKRSGRRWMRLVYDNYGCHREAYKALLRKAVELVGTLPSMCLNINTEIQESHQQHVSSNGNMADSCGRCIFRYRSSECIDHQKCIPGLGYYKSVWRRVKKGKDD
jgi:hypothetical protein